MLKNQRHGGQGNGQLDGVIRQTIFQILAHPPEHPPPGFILEPRCVDFFGEHKARSGAPHEQGAARADGRGVGHRDPMGLRAEGAGAQLHDHRHHGRRRGPGAEYAGHQGGDDHDGHDQQLGVVDAALKSVGRPFQKPGLADHLGKEQEGGDGEHGLEIHALFHPDLLQGTDHHGRCVAQHRDDLRGKYILRDEAPRQEHGEEHRSQPFQHIEPDLNVPVLALQVADGKGTDGAVVPPLPDVQPPYQQQRGGGEREQGKGVGEIADKVRNARGENDNGREIPHGGGCSAGGGEGEDDGEEGAHIPAVHLDGLEQDEYDGQDHHHGGDVVQAGGDEEHHGAEQDQAEPLFPSGELGDPDGQQLHDAGAGAEVSEQLHDDEDHQHVVGVAAHNAFDGDTEAEGQSSAPQKHGGDEQERGIFAQTAEQPGCPPAAGCGAVSGAAAEGQSVICHNDLLHSVLRRFWQTSIQPSYRAAVSSSR